MTRKEKDRGPGRPGAGDWGSGVRDQASEDTLLLPPLWGKVRLTAPSPLVGEGRDGGIDLNTDAFMKTHTTYRNRESGFTLIEIIVSLVIFGLMLTLAGMGIVMAAKGYVMTKENAHMAQKAQLAMARINREILEITNIAAAVTTQPDPYIIYDHVDGRRAIAKGGNVIKMFFNLGSSQTTLSFSDGDILIDDVTQFTLAYYKSDSSVWVFGTDDIKELSSVNVEIVMSRADSDIGDKTFEMTIRPRNTGG